MESGTPGGTGAPKHRLINEKNYARYRNNTYGISRFCQRPIFGEHLIFWGVGELARQNLSFYPGDLENSDSTCMISNYFETKLHWQLECCKSNAKVSTKWSSALATHNYVAICMPPKATVSLVQSFNSWTPLRSTIDQMQKIRVLTEKVYM